MKLALFDFDGTITRHDTFISFGRFALGPWRFLKALLLSAPQIIAWKLNLASNAEAKQALFSRLYKGMKLDDFQKLGRRFAEVVESDIKPVADTLIRQHLAAGHTVAIVSASIGDWIRPWAASKGIDIVLATEPETDSNGLLTGRFSTPNCHGPEKVRRINQQFTLTPDSEIWAYGDSKADEPMLALATHCGLQKIL